MIKRSIHQEDITSINIPNNRVLKYIKQNPTQLKGEIDNLSKIMGDFNISFSIIEEPDRGPRRQRYLNSIINQIELKSIYKTLYSTTAKNTFFSNAHGTFSRIDHMLGHKTSLNKFERIKIIQSMFSNPME